MGDSRAAQVFLDREEEALVGGDLRQLALHRVVQTALLCELLEEERHRPAPREGGHAQEDPARLRILRDRLEGLDVVEPVSCHPRLNEPWRAPDTGFARGDLSYIRSEVGDAGDAHLRRQLRL